MRLLIISVLVVAMIGVMVPSVHAEELGIECDHTSSYNYELIFDCTKKLDVNIGVLGSMFEDIRWISDTFNGAKLYNIQQNNFGGTATMEIPLPVVASLKSDIEFSKSDSNYKINFLTGKLAGSEMILQLANTSGFNETPNMGTDVSLSFKIKKIVCYGISFIKKCSGPDDVMYALDKGMYLIEPKAKIVQQEKPELIILPTSPPKATTPTAEPIIEEAFYEEVKTNPLVIQVEEQFDAQPKKEYSEPIALTVPLVAGWGWFGGTIELDQITYAQHDRVYIAIVAPNWNEDPYSVDTIGDKNSRLTIATDRGALVNYELTETGDDTGIFMGEVTLVGDNPTRGYGPIQGELSSYGQDTLDVILEVVVQLPGEEPSYESLMGTAKINAWLGELVWLDDNYSSSDVATLRLVDDIKNNPDEIDTVSVKVTSDSDPEGKIVTLRETDGNSWIFEGKVRFSTSSSGTLLVSPGDTVTASYVDETLPQEFFKNESMTLNTETRIEGKKLYIPETTPPPSIPEVTSMKISSDKEYYVVGDKVWIEGVALSPTSNVNLKVIDPEGNLIKMFQANVMRGNQFDATFDIEKDFFPLIGSYDVIAWQSSASEDMDVITINIGITGSDTVKKLGIPAWIKNNAGWWAEGQIDDNSFVKGIEYLVKVGLIQVT